MSTTTLHYSRARNAYEAGNGYTGWYDFYFANALLGTFDATGSSWDCPGAPAAVGQVTVGVYAEVIEGDVEEYFYDVGTGTTALTGSNSLGAATWAGLNLVWGSATDAQIDPGTITNIVYTPDAAPEGSCVPVLSSGAIHSAVFGGQVITG
jgi:hypothetical protein